MSRRYREKEPVLLRLKNYYTEEKIKELERKREKKVQVKADRMWSDILLPYD